jgi:hypothetical protein
MWWCPDQYELEFKPITQQMTRSVIVSNGNTKQELQTDEVM